MTHRRPPSLPIAQQRSRRERRAGRTALERAGWLRVGVLALVVLLRSGPGVAAPITGADRDTRLTIYSEVLGEPRELRIRLPAAYHHRLEKRYPVFYVSDADWNFPLVAETLEFLAHWGRIPPFIVVGMMNVSRNRDFLPRQDPAFPSSGSGDRYLRHLDQELVAWIDDRFRTSEERVLFGHSFGGVLVIHQWLEAPSTFNAYISIGASLWVADQALLERAEQALSEGVSGESWLYLSVGEGDGGQTVPAGVRFAELLEAHAPPTLEWSHTVMPEETHFSNVPISLHHALTALFPTWADDRSLYESGATGGADAVVDWFSERRARLGWRFAPQALELGLAALHLALEGHEEAGLAALDELADALPSDPTVAQLRGQALAGLGRKEAALAALDRALRLARRDGAHPDRLQRLENYRASIDGRP